MFDDAGATRFCAPGVGAAGQEDGDAGARGGGAAGAGLRRLPGGGAGALAPGQGGRTGKWFLCCALLQTIHLALLHVAGQGAAHCKDCCRHSF